MFLRVNGPLLCHCGAVTLPIRVNGKHILTIFIRVNSVLAQGGAALTLTIRVNVNIGSTNGLYSST